MTHTDPDYVLGAVLAQLEDLEPHQQRQVLVDAMTNVAAATPPVQAEPDDVIGMSRDELRAWARSLKSEHDPTTQDSSNRGRCEHCHFTRHPCDTYDLASAVLELLD